MKVAIYTTSYSNGSAWDQTLENIVRLETLGDVRCPRMDWPSYASHIKISLD